MPIRESAAGVKLSETWYKPSIPGVHRQDGEKIELEDSLLEPFRFRLELIRRRESSLHAPGSGVGNGWVKKW
jgi:hypothetical protein